MIGLLASAQRSVRTQTAESDDDAGTTADEEIRDGTDGEDLSKDQAFDILRNSRRRAVVSCLRSRGGELSVKELSRCVASTEYEIPAAELSSDQYKRVYTGLYQCHLDRMEELGVLDFDTETNTVRLHDVASQLEPYLDVEEGLNATRVELGAAVVVAAILTLGAAGVSPIGSASPTLLAAVTIAALLGLAVFQVFDLPEFGR